VTESPPNTIKRPLIVRILCALAWLMLIYIGVNFLVGGIVGGIAGAGETTAAAGSAAGQQAAEEFYSNYGVLVLAGILIAFVGLLMSGKLPGTGQYKQLKRSMPVNADQSGSSD